MTHLPRMMCCKGLNRQGLNSKEGADISCRNAPCTMTKTHQPRYSRMIGSSTASLDAAGTTLPRRSHSYGVNRQRALMALDYEEAGKPEYRGRPL